MSMIAAAALKMAKHAAKEQLKQDLAAAQKELEFTKNDLDNIRICWKTLEQSRDKAKSALADARAEVKEAHLAKDRVDNKFRTMEGVLKRANAQIGELQRELEVVEEEKEGMKKLLEKKMAKGDTEVTD